MPSLESLKQSILTECEEDHFGLWSVIRDVEELFPKKDEPAVRDRVLTLLHELLLAHEIEAGYPAPDGRGFRPCKSLQTRFSPGLRRNGLLVVARPSVKASGLRGRKRKAEVEGYRLTSGRGRERSG
jgi:hypothetical protein